jgi:hypothetical protein
LLLQILKLGHDPALDFQDNLRRIRSFRRCACVGECTVKSVRQVTLRWFCGGGGSRRWRRPKGHGQNAVRQASSSRANTRAGRLQSPRKATRYLSLFLVGKPTNAQ